MYRSAAVLVLFISALFAGCSSTARFTQSPQVQQESSAKPDFAPERKQTDAAKNFDPSTVVEPLEVEIGIASYYADKYNGRPTATGVIYDMNGISAAHPFHPLGTIARVTNLVNNKSVILEINDRMPYRPDRIMDLSLGAARELDMVIAGIQKVKLEVLKWGTGKRIERVKNPS